MKRIIILAAVALATLPMISIAQADLRKKIEVNGIAERTVRPDQIFLSITLKEYKNGSRIVEMDRLEAGLLKALRKVDIEKDKLTAESIFGYNWDWKKKRPDDFLASKSFRLEVADLKKINDLVEELDPEGLSALNIAEIRHSQEDQIREELAREALVNARNKAIAILDAIDEEAGGVLQVTTNQFQGPVPQARMRYNAMDESVEYASDVEFRNIDLKVEVFAIFEIK